MIIGEDEKNVWLFAAKRVQPEADEQKAKRIDFHVNIMCPARFLLH
jgi:hypothetical protein